MSSALHEATELDGRYARYVNDNLADYLVPVNADVPSVEVIMLAEQDDHINPAGVKGLGELAMSAPMQRSAMRSSTLPAGAFASCRCGWSSLRSRLCLLDIFGRATFVVAAGPVA